MDYQNFPFFMRPGANFNPQQMLEFAKQNNPMFSNMKMNKNNDNSKCKKNSNFLFIHNNKSIF